MTLAERYKRQPAARNLPAIEVLQNAETKSDVCKKVFATWNNGYNCEMFGIFITMLNSSQAVISRITALTIWQISLTTVTVLHILHSQYSTFK